MITTSVTGRGAEGRIVPFVITTLTPLRTRLLRFELWHTSGSLTRRLI